MKKILSIILIAISFFPNIVAAAPAFTVSQGGTGTGTPWSKYPIVGNGASPLQASSTPWVVGINATGTSDALASTFSAARIVNGTTTNATSTSFFATTASTTRLFGSNLAACNTSSFLTWATGLFGCSPVVAGYPFTSATNYAGTVSATGTPIWGQAGLQASSTSYFDGLVAKNSTTTNATTTIQSVQNLTATGSTTLQNFTFVNATGTSATTTNSFSTNATVTNLLATYSTTTGATTTALYANSGGIATSGSTTLQNFTFKNATGTNATTTNSFATTASSTNLFTSNLVANISVYSSFTYSTSTWAGTTTKAIGPSAVNELWQSGSCFSNAGTVNVSVNDGTNLMTMIPVTTSVATTNFILNNYLAAGTKRYISIGTPGSGPTEVSCTFKKVILTN